MLLEMEQIFFKNDFLDGSRRTPLMHAAAVGGCIGARICENLLRHKAAVGRKDASGWTALHHAAIGGHLEVCEVLLRHRANPCEGLVGAAEQGWASVCSLLLRFPGCTQQILADALHSALQIGTEFRTTRAVLLEAKADINSRGPVNFSRSGYAINMGSSVLDSAMLNKNGPIEEREQVWLELLANGAKPTELALTSATTYGRLNFVEVLLKRKISPDALYFGPEHRRPLAIAATLGNTEMMGLLLRYGADSGRALLFVLYEAPEEVPVNVLELLLQHVNFDATPVLRALSDFQRRGHFVMIAARRPAYVPILLQYGCHPASSWSRVDVQRSFSLGGVTVRMYPLSDGGGPDRDLDFQGFPGRKQYEIGDLMNGDSAIIMAARRGTRGLPVLRELVRAIAALPQDDQARLYSYRNRADLSALDVSACTASTDLLLEASPSLLISQVPRALAHACRRLGSLDCGGSKRLLEEGDSCTSCGPQTKLWCPICAKDVLLSRFRHHGCPGWEEVEARACVICDEDSFFPADRPQLEELILELISRLPPEPQGAPSLVDSALVCSVFARNLRICTALLACGADVNGSADNDFTPATTALHAAVLACDRKDTAHPQDMAQIVEVLLEAKADVDHENPLRSACAAVPPVPPVLEIRSHLLQVGSASATVPQQHAPEIHACIQTLLSHKARPNATAPDGSAALHFAVQENLVSVTRMLLEAGADPNLAWGTETPLVLAIRYSLKPPVRLGGQRISDDDDMVQILLEDPRTDPRANAQDILLALQNALRHSASALDKAQLLLQDSRIPLEVVDNVFGEAAAAWLAAARCWDRCLERLDRCGTESERQRLLSTSISMGFRSCTPLRAAALYWNAEAVSALLDRGAGLQSDLVLFRCALANEQHTARRGGDLERTCSLLLQHDTHACTTHQFRKVGNESILVDVGPMDETGRLCSLFVKHGARLARHDVHTFDDLATVPASNAVHGLMWDMEKVVWIGALHRSSQSLLARLSPELVRHILRQIVPIDPIDDTIPTPLLSESSSSEGYYDSDSPEDFLGYGGPFGYYY